MMKAGIIEEMLEDTMEGLEDDDLEEAADTEVEKVLWELTKGRRSSVRILLLKMDIFLTNASFGISACLSFAST